MKQEIYKSSRHFSLFDFVISHGQFLLRSQKTETSKNLDIIFFDTTYIQMFTRLDGICINRILETPHNIEYATVKKYLAFPNKYLFELESNNEKYFVAASFVRVFENSLEFNESSLIIEEGRKIEIATSLDFHK